MGGVRDGRRCASADEVRRFYERQGRYLALLHALEATDFHCENLIAAGEHPVLLDLEALFHPRPRESDARPARLAAGITLGDSVLRVGLLPQRVWENAESEGVDISGLGAPAEQLTPGPVPHIEAPGTDAMRLTRKRVPMPGSDNRPSLNSQEVNLLDYADAIAAGFSAMYRLLREHREELLAPQGPLARFAEDETRVVLRATRRYAVLLGES